MSSSVSFAAARGIGSGRRDRWPPCPAISGWAGGGGDLHDLQACRPPTKTANGDDDVNDDTMVGGGETFQKAGRKIWASGSGIRPNMEGVSGGEASTLTVVRSDRVVADPTQRSPVVRSTDPKRPESPPMTRVSGIVAENITKKQIEDIIKKLFEKWGDRNLRAAFANTQGQEPVLAIPFAPHLFDARRDNQH